MPFPTTFRPSVVWLALFVLGLAPGFISGVEADNEARPDPPSPPAAISAQRRAAFGLLRELDLFLDHHPLIEIDLRVEPLLLENPRYLEAHPALGQFLLANPAVDAVLKAEPRHLLHRALRREANVPLKWSEVAELDTFLDRNPAVERQLVRNPTLIREPGFLAVEAPLQDFLARHAALSRGFLPAAPPT
jgi:hypothetical protein